MINRWPACPCDPCSLATPTRLGNAAQEANKRLEKEVDDLKGQCADVTRQADDARWVLPNRHSKGRVAGAAQLPLRGQGGGWHLPQ